MRVLICLNKGNELFVKWLLWDHYFFKHFTLTIYKYKCPRRQKMNGRCWTCHLQCGEWMNEWWHGWLSQLCREFNTIKTRAWNTNSSTITPNNTFFQFYEKKHQVSGLFLDCSMGRFTADMTSWRCLTCHRQHDNGRFRGRSSSGRLVWQCITRQIKKGVFRLGNKCLCGGI